MRLKELKNEMMKIASSLDNPSLEVRLIIEKTLSLSAIDQIMKAESAVSKEDEEKSLQLIKKRAQGYPMAYITNEKEFYGHSFYVNESVLIPRPDTEVIVDAAIKIARETGKRRILDLCTGSGAIAASISHALNSDVFLSDISKEALEIARGNYERITERAAHARLGDLFEPWQDESFDIIVSNPPYLTDAWYEETDEDVKKEPKLALIGFGDDGLDIIRRIIKASVDHLNDGGFLLIEGDYRQMEYCAKIFKSEGFVDVGILKDLSGKDRVVYGRRNDL